MEWRGLSVLAVHGWVRMSPLHPGADQAPDQALTKSEIRVVPRTPSVYTRPRVAKGMPRLKAGEASECECVCLWIRGGGLWASSGLWAGPSRAADPGLEPGDLNHRAPRQAGVGTETPGQAWW